MPRIAELAEGVAIRLREEILAGKWTGRGLPSERELSEMYRVARRTARRGLKQLCSEQLLQARPGIGYVVVPGAVAKQPHEQGQAVLFCFVDSHGGVSMDPVDTGIMNGASVEARSRGLELYATCQEPAVFRQIVTKRKGQDLRGVLLNWARRDLAEFLLEADVPFVVVGDDIEGLPIAAVIQDNAAGTRAVLEQMSKAGHRRIGLVVNSLQRVHPQQRMAAYREFMLCSGPGVVPELIVTDEPGTEGGRRAAARLFDLPRDRWPTAVYVASRGMLDGVIAELTAHGLSYPSDVSLATWGEPGRGEPAGDKRDVTYVAWDRQELGRVAFLALEERIRSGCAERMVFRIAPQVVDCGSVTGCQDGAREGEGR